MTSTRRDRQHGFTLLEILVALVVLGLLLAALASGVDFGLRTWTLQSRVIDRSGELEAVDAALRRLIVNADPGLDQPRANLTGSAHHLECAATLPGPAPGGEPTPVTVAIDLDSKHQLVLAWLPAPHARRLAPAPPPTRSILLQGVAGLDISYFSPSGWRQDWTDPSMPSLIRIRLNFVSPSRSWPDIIAAPARESLQQ